MRASVLVLLLALVPTALAMPPFIETYEGHASSRAYYAGGRTICQDDGDATLYVEREMEAATFTLVLQAACVPTMTMRGVLTADGWRFEEPTVTFDGSFELNEHGSWSLHVRADGCPPGTICEFASGVHIDGEFLPGFGIL